MWRFPLLLGAILDQGRVAMGHGIGTEHGGQLAVVVRTITVHARTLKLDRAGLE
jgi:hypothetical protein